MNPRYGLPTNPRVVGSIPTGPTMLELPFRARWHGASVTTRGWVPSDDVTLSDLVAP